MQSISIALSALISREQYRLKTCPHCRRKVRLSLNSATVAVIVSPFSATVALFCDSVDMALSVRLKSPKPTDRLRNSVGSEFQTLCYRGRATITGGK